jgi:hypothetical protein
MSSAHFPGVTVSDHMSLSHSGARYTAV